MCATTALLKYYISLPVKTFKILRKKVKQGNKKSLSLRSFAPIQASVSEVLSIIPWNLVVVKSYM